MRVVLLPLIFFPNPLFDQIAFPSTVAPIHVLPSTTSPTSKQSTSNFPFPALNNMPKIAIQTPRKWKQATMRTRNLYKNGKFSIVKINNI